MAQQVLTSPTLPRRFQGLLLIGVTLGFLLLFTIWSGVPQGENALPFWIGIGVLIALLFAIGFAAWHLLFRPLPVGHKAVSVQPMKAQHRQLLVVLLTICAISLIVGAFWDEAWHRIYGLPFGEDFFWRPHLLMYFGFLTIPLLGFAGFYVMMRRGKGTLQQRFRANPIIGLMVLACVFVIYVIPADPIWHAIYGEDIATWSLPHLLLFFSFHVVMALALAIHMSTLPLRDWGSVRQLQLSDFIPLLIFAFNLNGGLQFLITDYDYVTVRQMSSLPDYMLSHPQWLLPSGIAGLSALIAAAAVHTMRRVGVATVVGIMAVLIRVALVEAFDFELMRWQTWLLVLPPMIAIDFVYAFTSPKNRRIPSVLISGMVAAIAMSLISLPLLNQFVLYPQVKSTSLLPMIAAISIATIGGGWLGEQYGDYLATSNKQVEAETTWNALRYLPIGALVAVLLFLVVFISTATPPV